MKIVFLSEKYTPDIGGPAISAGRLGHLLSSAGYEVRVFSPSLDLPAYETRTLTHSGISVTRFGAQTRVRYPAYFLPQAGFVAAYAGNYLSVPSVFSEGQ